jgi:hypothetical protein
VFPCVFTQLTNSIIVSRLGNFRARRDQKPHRSAWQKQGWNMEIARSRCHLADIQEQVGDLQALATQK